MDRTRLEGAYGGEAVDIQRGTLSSLKALHLAGRASGLDAIILYESGKVTSVRSGQMLDMLHRLVQQGSVQGSSETLGSDMRLPG